MDNYRAESSTSASGDEGSGPNKQQFTTDHLLTNLRGRTVSSGFITGVAQVAQVALNLGSIMVLARLLTPQDFGLVAMATTVMGFMRIFSDAGLSTATVQREGITHAQVSNLFWANLALGGLISLVLAVSAPAVAWFYREPRLVGITLALCITFLVNGSTVQHLALLKRQMRFGALAIIQIGSMASGILLGIGMAWLEFGYWSLVGMQLFTPLAAFLLTWLAFRWRPQWPTRDSGTRSLLNFGANLTASGFIWSVARGSDGLLIGRFYGSDSLGFYSRAQALLLRPIEQFVGPLETIFVPTLARLQVQPERYRRIVLQAYDVVAITSFLFTGMMLALAYPITFVVLGPQWENAAAIFAGFTLVALYAPVASVSNWLLTSQGRGWHMFFLSLIGSLATVLAFIAGLPFGPVGVAIAYSAQCLFISLPLAYHVVGWQGPVTAKDLWSRFFKHFPVWGVVSSITWLTRATIMNFAPWKQLVICVPVGLLVGIVFICAYAPSRRSALSVLDLLSGWKMSRIELLDKDPG